MAKIYGINGVITGKLGAAVYAVRNGEQISRRYQPIVANPQTAGQIEARAKLKMCSQLSAILAPYIAMPRDGAVSPRNRFMKKNYKSLTYENLEAKMTLEDIKLTDSVVFLPNITLTSTGTVVTAKITPGGTNIDRVVFVNCMITPSKELRVLDSEVVSTPDPNGDFAITFGAGGGYEGLLLVYGVRDNNANARAAYGDVEVLSAQDVARLVVSRTLTEADITLTETRGVKFNTGDIQ